MGSIDAALAALRRHQAATLALAERLVRINSHTANREGVNQVGELLVQALAGLPLSLQREPGQGTGDHLCWSTTKASQAPPVLLVGHHDTVFPPGVFEGWEVRDGRAHGPGTLDMKTALAMCVHVLWALHEAGALEERPLRFISVADEETGSCHSRTWLRTRARGARAGLVFEAGRGPDLVITARRGTGFARVVAHGRAAHAGNALAEGRNAIVQLARFIERAHTLTERVPGASVNVGLIEGGTARNTVPAEARCELDLRFDDDEARRALFAALREEVERFCGDGFRLTLHAEVARPAMVPSEASRALCARYIACQRAAGLGGRESPRVGGGSDANNLSAEGVPTIDALGPQGAGFHTPQEYVELDSVPRKAEALLRFLLSDAAETPNSGTKQT